MANKHYTVGECVDALSAAHKQITRIFEIQGNREDSGVERPDYILTEEGEEIGFRDMIDPCDLDLEMFCEAFIKLTEIVEHFVNKVEV